MKKLIIILFLIPVFCNAQLAQDKQAHLFTSYTLGVAGNGIVWELTGNKWLAFGSGVALGTGLGLIKESFDREFSKEDMKYNIAGAFLGSFTLRIVIGNAIHRKKVPINDRWKID